jgi:hypothetical protein
MQEQILLPTGAKRHCRFKTLYLPTFCPKFTLRLLTISPPLPHSFAKEPLMSFVRYGEAIARACAISCATLS